MPGINPDSPKARQQGKLIKYARNCRTISGRLHDELVMMDLDQGKYFALNPVATRIWDLLDSPLSAGEICIILTEEYDVGQEQCLKEVEEHFSELMRLGLIVRMES